MDMEENKIPEETEELLNEENEKAPKTVSLKKAVTVTVASVIVSACIAVFATVSFINLSGYNSFGLDKDSYNKLKWGFKAVSDTYYGEFDKKEVIDGALTGVSLALDEYTMYLPKNAAEDFIQSVDGEEYSGVGLYIYNNTEDNTITVISPLKDSPAERAGIKSNDKITAIDKTPVTGADIDKAADMMMGKEETTVKLTVIKADTGKTEIVELKREKIKLETVGSEMLEDEIGYIQITQFGANTYKEFVEHYNNLCDEGMDKLIIDLRNNAGGYFNQAVNIADIFIDKGKVIVYTKDKNGKKEEYKAVTDAVEIEIVILANEGTASASEVLIGALCDHGKAVLVGEKTFGKGVTQALITHKDGSAFKITDTKYYTPNGLCIDKKGISPSIEADDSGDLDLVLKAGIKAFD